MEEWERELQAREDDDCVFDINIVLNLYMDALMDRVNLCQHLGQETTMRALLRVVEDISKIMGLI